MTAQRVEPRARDALVVEGTRLRTASSLRDARRARNRTRGHFNGELRCECAWPACQATVPVVAETYRRTPQRFIVVPDHSAGETVVAAADRFFVVEPQGQPSR
jgi:hypothetical protein